MTKSSACEAALCMHLEYRETSVNDFHVLIPARLASTRLPNKPLADIAGKPMIVRVAECAQRAVEPLAVLSPAPSNRVVVAADSPDIVDACARHGVRAVLTRTDHASGSDRLAEACDLLALADDALVVNLQGDEPLMDPQLIRDVAHLLPMRPLASMSTAAHVIDSLQDFNNPNVVKVVVDAQGLALYFSRSAIPFARDAAPLARDLVTGPDGALARPWWLAPGPRHAAAPLRHIGIYAYRAGFLRQFPALAPAPIEGVEALEQLRAMWHGHRIAVTVTAHAPGPGVDTPADLARVRQHFATPNPT